VGEGKKRRDLGGKKGPVEVEGSDFLGYKSGMGTGKEKFNKITLKRVSYDGVRPITRKIKQ